MITTGHIHRRLADRRERLELLKRYLQSCYSEGDWHGVEDAASDIRDVESAVAELEWVLTLETDR